MLALQSSLARRRGSPLPVVLGVAGVVALTAAISGWLVLADPSEAPDTTSVAVAAPDAERGPETEPETEPEPAPDLRPAAAPDPGAPTNAAPNAPAASPADPAARKQAQGELSDPDMLEDPLRARGTARSPLAR